MIWPWLYAMAAMLGVAGLARLAFLLVWRRPVAARTHGTDLSEMERRRDADFRRPARFDHTLTSDNIPVRGVLARVAYDFDGRAYRADVCLLTRKGDRATAAPVIWVDPARPSRATGLGPASALWLWLVAGGLAVAAHHCPL